MTQPRKRAAPRVAYVINVRSSRWRVTFTVWRVESGTRHPVARHRFWTRVTDDDALRESAQGWGMPHVRADQRRRGVLK